MWRWTKRSHSIRYGATNVARNRTVAAQNLSASVIDVEAIDAKTSHGKRAGLPTSRRTCDDNHPRTGHAASPCLERRVRLGQHVGRQLVGHEVAFRVDNA